MIRMALAVVAGGVVGTLIRFGIATWVSAHWPRHFYLATLAVNLLGCLLIGYLYASFLARPDISPELRGGLIIGFLGALTTFSSFSLDGLRLLESGQRAAGKAQPRRGGAARQLDRQPRGTEPRRHGGIAEPPGIIGGTRRPRLRAEQCLPGDGLGRSHAR